MAPPTKLFHKIQPIVNLVVNLVVNHVVILIVNVVVKLIVNLVVNTLSSKRLNAKRQYVILAKALDGIWPVGHACAVLC